MTKYEELQEHLKSNQYTWLITGVAGFIGSNLLEKLLILNQKVVGLDNFDTGHQYNIDQAIADANNAIGEDKINNFIFIEGDIRQFEDCEKAMCFRSSSPVDFVLHQAALGSVPRSIEDPIRTNKANIDGFLNILVAAKDANVKRFVYAASSSTYGDHPDLPKVEDKIGKPLSPYSVTKVVNELYADVFAKTYGFKTIGLRYFNIFGKRQDPNGAYAAVIPKWADVMIQNGLVWINGDGETSRDFCYIDNTVQANLLAATVENEEATNQIYNIAVGDRTTLNELFEAIRSALEPNFPHLKDYKSNYRDFRAGDVRHSLADISKAFKLIGYEPSCRIGEGIRMTMAWYRQQSKFNDKNET